MSSPIKYFFLIIILFLGKGIYSQKSQFNHWCIDISAGVTNAVKPYSPGYWSNTVGFLNSSLGSRYMFNNKFGLKLDFAYDRIKNDESGIFVNNDNSLPFQSNYFRSSIQGFMDIGRIMAFENFSDRFSLLFHTGGGLSVLTSKINPETDKMVNFLFGFTPQIKLSNKVALNFDASFIWHIYQQYTFDMYNPVYQRGFDGFIANATVGVSIYLGKHKNHYDWVSSPCYPDMTYLEKENKKLDSLNKKLNLNIEDGDGDGVINFVDLEKETQMGDSVDCSGVSIKNLDSDKDGVSDLIDKCKDMPGEVQFEGCPKSVYEAFKNLNEQNNNTNNINNNSSNNTNSNSFNSSTNNNASNNNNNSSNNNAINNSLNENGSSTNNTNSNYNNNVNTSTQPSVITDKSGYSSLTDFQFELNKEVINATAYSSLKEIVNLLKANPNAKIALEGHTDNTGETTFNDKLALKRANSVKQYFLSQGIQENRIQIAAFGESKPKYLNVTSTGRAMNRRVEIYIKN
jgi:outer membrane protein OmpA-like peptidoglycan-associated protein